MGQLAEVTRANTKQQQRIDELETLLLSALARITALE
jgi:hypothetical protein